MASSEAGPSSGIVREVMLSVEPVHIYADATLPSCTSPDASSSIVDAFERERKLQDITSDGTNVFAERKPAAVKLSEDVRRLWVERGDFSRFRTSDLLRKRSRDREQRAEEKQDSDDDDDDEPDGMDGKKKERGTEDAGEQALLRKNGEAVGGTIGESEFVELRNRVLASLDVAHFNSIHAHQLLGMLIKQHRTGTQTTNSSTNAAAGRLGSPAPSVGGQSARSGSTATHAPPLSKAPLGIFSHLTHPAAAREEEFILDPLSISLSRTSLNASTAARRNLGEESGAEDDDEDDDYSADPTSAAYGLKQARRELEGDQGYKENRLREFKVVLETKRKAMRNAAELLSSAADELRASHAPNRERWRALIGLHARGWRLTPGRPLLDVERFGVSSTAEDDDEAEVEGVDEKAADENQRKAQGAKEGKKVAAGLQGFGTPIMTSDGKVKDEGARDAWIGFGLAEAPIELRRRSLAYWADLRSSTSSTGSEQEVKQKLVFPDRMHRRLRIRFVLWSSSTTAQERGGRREWSSDHTPSKPHGASEARRAPMVVGHILDQELQDASREASDELVFGDVVAQARLLPPSFGVRLTPESVRIVLTKRLDMVVELVPTTSNQELKEQTEEEEEEEEEGGEKMRYAPHAELLLAFLRLGPLRKYQAFVGATREGRRSDATARAAAIKAIALAVPKKSKANPASVSSAGKADTVCGAGAGAAIAAGGKTSSDALSKLDTLGPILVGLHYWSFVHRLGTLLKQVQTGAEQNGAMRVRVQLVPLALTPTSSGSAMPGLVQLSTWLGESIDATPYRERDAGLHTIYLRPPASANMDALRGYAKVYLHHRLVCTLAFRQPSLLTVQFATPPSSKHNQRTPVRLTTHPLNVDLDTLATLLPQQLRLYT